MFILLAWRNLKIAAPMHEIIQIWLKHKQKTEILRRSRVIGFKFLVLSHIMLDYASTALFGYLCYRKWIMPFMLLMLPA